jgi:WD40 repeat protein/transcriptional regulator with XRE-family HTH domain
MGRKDKIVQSDNAQLGARMRRARQEKSISLTEMSKRLNYSKGHLSAVENNEGRPSTDLVEKYEQILELEPGILSRVLEGTEQDLIYQGISLPPTNQEQSEQQVKVDWGEAPHVIPSCFYGREQELTDLEQWIVKDRCQMVAVLGFGGIGKTTLTALLAEQIADIFEYVFWRSLQNAPPLEYVLKSCIQFLSDHQQAELPEDLDSQIIMLIKYLREHRCLIILDNVESVLGTGERSGQYREKYEGYGTLIQRLGEMKHQGCLLLTSREKPREVSRLEGKYLPVRSMHLPGVTISEGRKMLEGDNLSGSDEIWAKFIDLYAGNPLALKLVSEPIRELFQGDVAAFLKQKATVVGNINDLLEEQFSRLSGLEQEIMYWLASERETISLDDLREDIVGLVSIEDLLEALQSLRRRSMIETKGTAHFSLQAVIMEYVTNKFVEQVYQEISTETIKLLASHVLIKAQAKEYVRESQIRLILKPLDERLLVMYGREESEKKLKSILRTVRKTYFQKPNYVAGNVVNLLIQLGCTLRNYDFSHLFVWQAYLQGVELPGVNFSHANLKKSVFTDTFGSILSVTLSPSGELLAAGTANGEVRLWLTASGTPLHTLEGHTDWVTSVTFSPNGNLLASGSDDQTIRLWDPRTGRCLEVLKDHSSRIRSVAFNLDGTLLASGSEDQTIRIWDVSKGQCVRVLEGHSKWVRSVAFSPDDDILASGSEDQTIRIWDIDTGQCIRVLEDHSNWVRSVAFSPDGTLLASGSDDHTIRLWKVSTGQCLRVIEGHSNRIYSVAFSPDGEMLASGSDDPSVRLWDVHTGQSLKVLSGHSNRVYSVAFSPTKDSMILASGSDDQTIRLWEVDRGEPLRILQGYSGRVRSVAFSPARDRMILASGSEDKTIQFWEVSANTRQGHCIRVLGGHTGRIRSVAFSPDGSILASGSEDPIVRLWEVNTGQSLKTLQSHGWVYSVAFSPDGNILASGNEDPDIRLWEIDAERCFQTLRGHSSWVYSIAFSPDGETLASGSDDRTIRLWDVSTGRCLTMLQGHENRVYTVAFSPDGSLLASGSHDHTIRLWEVNTGQCLKILQGHSSWVYSVAFSPDGNILASGSEDPTVRLWDVRTGRSLTILRGHSSWVYSVAFSPDGCFLASGSHDGTIRLWNTQTGEHLLTLRSERPYEGLRILDVEGVTSEQKATLKALGAIDD